jgi:hypothetical protein
VRHQCPESAANKKIIFVVVNGCSRLGVVISVARFDDDSDLDLHGQSLVIGSLTNGKIGAACTKKATSAGLSSRPRD